jgi:hypothetical protein
VSDGVDRVVVGLEAPGAPRAGWGASPCRGTFHHPAGEPAPRVAYLATHYNLPFDEHYLAGHMARRGHGFLGWNTRFCGNEAFFRLDRALVDIAAGVRWLRKRGAAVVVALGNSGGGSLMAAYQAEAVRAGELEPFDLYVSVAAHPGRPEVLTAWLDPAVREEADPLATDPALDMYDAANGPPYSPGFAERYRAAQRERNRAITRWTEAELERVAAAGYADRLFTVRRTWADLRFADPAIDPSDRPTPACYAGDPAKANHGVAGLAAVSTLRTWLDMWSLDRSPCRAAEHLAEIDLPALVVQPTEDVGVFPSDARAIHDGLASADKQLVELPGDHYFRGEERRAELAGLIAGWVAAR